MKKRLAALTAIIALALLALATPAPALTIECWLFYPSLEGDGAAPGAPITVTLRDSADAVRGIVHRVADAGGHWHASFENGAVLQPRDKVHVDIGGTGYDHQLSLINIRSIDVQNNLVTGRIRPRRDQVTTYVRSRVLDSTGWLADEFTTDNVVPDAEGRFTIDTTPWGDIRRLSEVRIGYLEPPFTVTRVELAPGLLLFPAGGFGYVTGIRGRHYEAILLGPGGAVRDTCGGTITGRYENYDLVEFTKPSGVPLRINAGNRIRIKGLGIFAVRVPPLEATLDPASNVCTVKSRPFRPVSLDLEHYDPVTGSWISMFTRVVVANAAGEASFDWTPLVDVMPGDVLNLSSMDAQGNVFEAYGQALP